MKADHISVSDVLDHSTVRIKTSRIMSAKKKYKNNIRPKDRLINIFFSLGASVVIMGTLFKLMHWQGAEIMLMTGMFTEAIIFAIGAFERPLKAYEWDKIFDFETGEPLHGSSQNPMTGTVGSTIPAGKSSNITDTHTQSDVVHGEVIESKKLAEGDSGKAGGSVAAMNISGGIVYAEEASKLSESIQQLSKTTEMIGEFSNASATTQKLNKNLETAAELTSKYLNSQEALIMAANKLQSTYEMIDAGMEGVERNTKIYAGKIEDIHKTLASINSIYEIHLNNIHIQTESWNQQAEAFKDVTEDIREVAQGMSKIKDVSVDALAETEKFKNSSRDLTEKIEELNKVYGNMLNALN